ncbi:ankyrin repeat domain-containing protein 50 [Microdochium nivale]|nr:ankyrin repeat domain-containing protein 50 [Microdochium nivale]
MAETIGLVASVAQLGVFATAMVQGIGRFIIDVRSLPDSLRELHDSIDTLRMAVNAIREAFRRRPSQLPFERNHHANIGRILLSCKEALLSLEKELPELKDKTTTTYKVVLALEKRIKDTRIQELLARITSCTTILQLSLSTLALGALWGTQESQAHIQAEIRNLTTSIRSARLFSKQPASSTASRLELMSRSIVAEHDLESENEDGFVCVDETKSVLDNEIQEWRESADDVAMAVLATKDLDRRYFVDSIAPESSVSLSMLPRYEEDTFDPEPGHLDIPSRKTLEYQLAANQQYVKEWRACGLFLRASAYQRRGIEMERQLQELQETQDSTDSFNKLANMKETLVAVLLECETEESNAEAKVMLQEALQEVVTRTPEEQNLLRKFRLYHMLGDLYYRQGMAQRVQLFLDKAKVFFERAFEGRKGVADCPPELIRESAEGLVRLLQASQEYDRAQGIQDWIRYELQPEAIPLGLSSPRNGRGSLVSTSDVGGNLSKILQWCKERSIDVDASGFRLDIACEDGITPVQRAIQEEDIDMLRDMLAHVSNVDEQRHAYTHATPLHMAASKRNKHLVALLLERHASAHELDEHGMLPLHRCQSASGGVKVAESLLIYAPDTIDVKDSRGKTALYMACEYGNEKMAALLLKRGACPNIQGSGSCTPLILAIELASKPSVRTAIIRLLLEHDANPRIRDTYGRSAFDAANNCGLGGAQIREMLADAAFSDHTSPRTSSISSAARSVASSKRTSTTGSSRCR